MAKTQGKALACSPIPEEKRCRHSVHELHLFRLLHLTQDFVVSRVLSKTWQNSRFPCIVPFLCETRTVAFRLSITLLKKIPHVDMETNIKRHV